MRYPPAPAHRSRCRLTSATIASYFSSLGQIDEVVEILAHHRLVGRDHHDLEAVDLSELEGLGIGGAGHAGQLVIHAEVVLEGDRGQGLVLALNLHALLGFQGLVQAFGDSGGPA
jgi:hypothetical protein